MQAVAYLNNVMLAVVVFKTSHEYNILRRETFKLNFTTRNAETEK